MFIFQCNFSQRLVPQVGHAAKVTTSSRISQLHQSFDNISAKNNDMPSVSRQGKDQISAYFLYQIYDNCMTQQQIHVGN